MELIAAYLKIQNEKRQMWTIDQIIKQQISKMSEKTYCGIVTDFDMYRLNRLYDHYYKEMLSLWGSSNIQQDASIITSSSTEDLYRNNNIKGLRTNTICLDEELVYD